MDRSRLALIVWPFLLACGSSQPKPEETPRTQAPAVVLPSGEGLTEAEESSPTVGPQLPGGNPPSDPSRRTPPSTVPPYTPPPPGSPEALFTGAVQGRWRTACERNLVTGTSRFFAIEFREDRWSTLLFEFSNRPDCTHIADLNEGQPRTYRYGVQAEQDGWFRISGLCLSPANACLGKTEVLVKITENQTLQVQRLPEGAANLWFPADQTELVYSIGSPAPL